MKWTASVLDKIKRRGFRMKTAALVGLRSNL
jgi:hypothetical protein